MTETKKTPSAGRPTETPTGGRKVTVYLPNELADMLKKLGSSKWVVSQLQKEMDMTDKNSAVATVIASLTKTEQFFLTDFVDGSDKDHTLQNLLDALCDGEALAYFLGKDEGKPVSQIAAETTMTENVYSAIEKLAKLYGYDKLVNEIFD